MRYVLPLIAVLALAGGAAAQGAPAGGTPVFVVSGGGWGHNVGLSQWGAFGQAKAGRTYDQILRQYFPGTKLEETPVRKVRVLVSEETRAARVASGAPFRVRDATGAVHDVARTEVQVDRRLRVPVLVDAENGAAVRATRRLALPGPLTFLPARGATMSLDGKGFRGRLELASSAKRLRVVMIVGLDAYVQGIVPGEMPKEWPLEALKAQAVAARTYAVAHLEQGKDWDVVADPYAFAYYGVAKEAPSTNTAVSETRGQVLTYRGGPITAFYFSSSGGRTLSSQDVFGVSLPYLRGGKDPWDAASPNHTWPVRTFTPKSLAVALRADRPVADVEVVPSAPGRPLGYVVATVAGASVSLRAGDVRTLLGLKSANFRIGILRLDPPAGAVPAGASVALVGAARDVGPAVLEQRGADGVWTPARRKLVVQPDGSFTVVVRPAETTVYRLSAAGLIGPSATVTVTPQAAG
ncbi:MAG TPA: SpoIID/LytB domain-containing protein [Gaiellaceae bacterium]|jgi:SpoIID/LytB domain protein|nr:SpoIID/LytB domain-containing protein [Gaiellaceae bacterium]